MQGVHPQLQWYLDDTAAQIDVYGKHSRYLVPFATVSARMALPSAIPPAIHEIMVKAGMDPADYDGRVSDIRRDAQRFKRAHGAAQGKDYAALNDDQLTDDYHYSIFPNVSLNVHADVVMMLRMRPHATDPNKMLYDIWMFELIPQGEPWPERPRHRRFRHGDRTIGTVLDQDAFNLPTVQKGMHSSAFAGLWIGDQGLRIRAFHKALSDYVYPDGSRAHHEETMMTDRSHEPPPHGDQEGICPNCRGTGEEDGVTCARCDGSGRLVEGIGGG